MTSSRIRPSARREGACPEEADLIIIGAGPAGLFAAINSASSNHDQNQRPHIVVLEKKSSPGRKLLISGQGRCNITHSGDIREFLNHYGEGGRFLRPALLGFTNHDLISFFAGKGLSMIEEESGKIFPRTGRSRDVLDVLLQECRARQVSIRCRQKVLSVSRDERGFKVVTGDEIYSSPLLVIATGGCSYPATGSTGDGYRFARDLGHAIVEPGPALTPVYIKDYPFADLAGVSVPDLLVSLQDSKRSQPDSKTTRTYCADLLFTHQGLSGPAILDFSRYLAPGHVLRLSFIRPGRRQELEAWLLKNAGEMGSSSIKTVLGDLPPAFFAFRPLTLSDSSPPSDSCLSPGSTSSPRTSSSPGTSTSSGSDGSCQVSGSSPSPGSSPPPSPRPSIPGRLIAKILEISGIPDGLQCAQLTRQMRIALLDNLTGLPLEISSLGGYDLAMVTRGGVDLREVNSRTMESRLVPGLYLVGEVLDVDGDTGGYNLQAAFSTGMLAARSIARMPGQSARTTRRTTGRG